MSRLSYAISAWVGTLGFHFIGTGETAGDARRLLMSDVRARGSEDDVRQVEQLLNAESEDENG